MRKGLSIRKARVEDIKRVHALVNKFARAEEMLPRSLKDLYEHLRDVYVCERADGAIKGTCSLRVLWDDLGEVRSLAVEEDARGAGIGRALVTRCLEEAAALGIKKVFALTYMPDFFRELGFRKIEKSALPHRIWGDCVNCPRFPECDETALLIRLDGKDA